MKKYVYSPPSADSPTSIETWRTERRKLIATLRQVADDLDTMEVRVRRTKVIAGVSSVAGGITAGALFIASFFTLGLTLPAAITVGILSGGGGVAAIGAEVGRYIHQNKLLKQAQILFDKDLEIAQCIKNSVSVMAGAGKAGIKLAEIIVDDIGGNAARITSGVSKAANVTKLAKVSGIIGLVLLPLDIGLLIHDSVQLHKGELHPAAIEIRKLADEKEQELKDTEVTT